jgi:uroporphyrinogen-III synthase
VAPDTVVLTQPALRTAPLVARLNARGVATECWPMSLIAAADGTDWVALAGGLAASDWVVFPSPGAIEVTLASLRAADLHWPAGPSIGLVGRGSVQALLPWRPHWSALRDARVLAPGGEDQDADALLALPEFAAVEGRRVAVISRVGVEPRGVQALRARGANVQVWGVYRVDPLAPPPHAGAWLAWRAAHRRGVAICVADAGSGRRLGGFVDRLPVGDWVRGQPLLTQHRRIAAALRADGWRCVHRHDPGTDGLVAALESLPDIER